MVEMITTLSARAQGRRTRLHGLVVVFNDLKGVQTERHSATRTKGERKHTKSDPKYSITLSKTAKSSRLVQPSEGDERREPYGAVDWARR